MGSWQPRRSAANAGRRRQWRQLRVVVAPRRVRVVRLRMRGQLLQGDLHRAFELRPETVLATIEAIDAFRRPERLDQFLAACEADFRGRSGFEKRPYPQAAYLRAAAAARGVSGRLVATDSLPGPAIAAKIRALRIAAIRDVKPSHIP